MKGIFSISLMNKMDGQGILQNKVLLSDIPYNLFNMNMNIGYCSCFFCFKGWQLILPSSKSWDIQLCHHSTYWICYVKRLKNPYPPKLYLLVVTFWEYHSVSSSTYHWHDHPMILIQMQLHLVVQCLVGILQCFYAYSLTT